MKYIKQLSIILGISFIGECLKACIPLAIPASIYGLIIMFLVLQLKWIKLNLVKETSLFLIEIMPIMFIPASVGIITSWPILKAIWFPLVVTTVCTTVIVMGTTGLVAQAIIKYRKRH